MFMFKYTFVLLACSTQGRTNTICILKNVLQAWQSAVKDVHAGSSRPANAHLLYPLLKLSNHMIAAESNNEIA
jgi:hypothetical protein